MNEFRKDDWFIKYRNPTVLDMLKIPQKLNFNSQGKTDKSEFELMTCLIEVAEDFITELSCGDYKTYQELLSDSKNLKFVSDFVTEFTLLFNTESTLKKKKK